MPNRAFVGVVASKAAITGCEPDCMGNEERIQQASIWHAGSRLRGRKVKRFANRALRLGAQSSIQLGQPTCPTWNRAAYSQLCEMGLHGFRLDVIVDVR
jgi:hypothetical protein